MNDEKYMRIEDILIDEYELAQPIFRRDNTTFKLADNGKVITQRVYKASKREGYVVLKVRKIDKEKR